jgi:hypothetical protein
VSRTKVAGFRDPDWRLVERAKTDFWIQQKAALTPSEVLRLGDELRRYAQAARPDWPDAAERDADLALHTRICQALRRASAYRSSSAPRRRS